MHDHFLTFCFHCRRVRAATACASNRTSVSTVTAVAQALTADPSDENKICDSIPVGTAERPIRRTLVRTWLGVYDGTSNRQRLPIRLADHVQLDANSVRHHSRYAPGA